MLQIDGATGGGQVVRTALSLSAVTGTPVEVTNVRGARPQAGLRPQHLAAVEAVAACCDAAVEGASVGSETVTFEPAGVRGGTHTIDIGTAGSVTLLFDSLLPLAVALAEPLSVTATGGTDVKWAPTMPYYRTVKLPLLERFGYAVDVSLARTGFYPVGGGEATLRLAPSTPAPVRLTERGRLEGVTVHSRASTSLEERAVAARQAERATDRLSAVGVPVDGTRVEYVETDSPGSVVALEARYEASRAGFDALGERGVTAEAVADRAVSAFRSFRDGPGAVDRFTADQLLVPLAIAGGRVSVPAVTDHLASNAAVVRAFGGAVRFEEGSDGGVAVESDGGFDGVAD